MKYHKQRFKHDPKNGLFGDCFRTAVACVLNMEPEQVPNFGIHYEDSALFNKTKDDWLLANGYKAFCFPLNGETPLETVLECMRVWNPDMYYFLSGQSDRGVNHVVIARNDRIIHDPHPSDTGLIGPCILDDGSRYWWIELITQIDLHIEVAA